MLCDDATTRVHRIDRIPGSTPEHRPLTPDDASGWQIPSLVRAPVSTVSSIPSVSAGSSHHLPNGAALGEHIVAEPRGRDGCFDLHVVTHAGRGSLHMARVLRREHASLAPTMLAAARRIQHNPQRNLRAVIEAGWTDEPEPRAFVVHERLVGRNLASLVAGGSGIEWPLVVAIGIQCAEALDALHQLGLAHTELRPRDATLVHVAGDQFRVVLGGLEHAQPIVPDACAAEEPDVEDDLFALGGMLVALAAGCATPAAPVPEVLECLLARMTDPRPAIRPSTAAELRDQLAAVYDHVDPSLSSVRMLGEALRKIVRDDFEVSIEFEELPPRPVRPISPLPPRPPGPASRWASQLLVSVVAVVAFLAGAALPDRPGPVTAQTLALPEDEPALARIVLRQVPAQQAAPAVVTLPRHVRASRPTCARPRAPAVPAPIDAAPSASSHSSDPSDAPVVAPPAAELARAPSDDSQDPDSPLLPVRRTASPDTAASS